MQSVAQAELLFLFSIWASDLIGDKFFWAFFRVFLNNLLQFVGQTTWE